MEGFEKNHELNKKIKIQLQDLKLIEAEDLNIYYRTLDLDTPQILSQKFNDKVALMIQIMPTFTPEP